MNDSQAKSKRTIVVTGSSGLIGSALCEALRDEYQVFGLDIRPPDVDLEDRCTFVHCDLTTDESVRDALSDVRDRGGSRLAAVIHLAAHYDFSGDPSPLYERLTVAGTERLLRELRTFEFVEQFIFCSSLLVMKPIDDGPARLTEESPTRAEWAYPRSKLHAEQVLHEQHAGIPVVILRLAGVYTDDCQSLPLVHHIRRIHARSPESYVFPGNADHGQPFIHIDDAAACFGKAIARRDELDLLETFLVAEPEVMSHARLQHELGQLIHGKSWPTVRVPKAAAKLGAAVKDAMTREDRFIRPWMIDLADDHYPVEIERARRRLAWEPRRRLQSALPEMIARLKKDPLGWYQRNGVEPPPEVKEHHCGESPALEPMRR